MKPFKHYLEEAMKRTDYKNWRTQNCYGYQAKKIGFRVKAGEEADIEAYAEKSGLTIAEYCRRRALKLRT